MVYRLGFSRDLSIPVRMFELLLKVELYCRLLLQGQALIRVLVRRPQGFYQRNGGLSRQVKHKDSRRLPRGLLVV